LRWSGVVSWLTKVAIAGAVALLAVVIAFRELTRIPPSPEDAHGLGHGRSGDPKAAAGKDEHGHDHGEQGEGFVKLTAEQVEAAGIEMAPAVSGTLMKEIAVPGRIAINADRQARIVPRLSGTVARIDRHLGGKVAEGDVLAVLESREMADGKAHYLAAWRAEELAQSTLQREERLWRQKVTAAQDYLNARNAHQLAKIKVDLARQRLHTMGLTEAEIEALAAAPDEKTFRFYEIRSPISGRVTARNLMLGQFVGTEKEVFTIADLGTV
jgi:cobalt-zinc-cadmium efflux system membrane fusion protein